MKPKKNYFYRVIRAIVKPFFLLKYRLKYIGVENIPEEGRFILASNHRHADDPIVIGLGVKREIMFMGKSELFKNKIAGWFFTKLGAFPVDRGKGDRTAIRHFEKVLEDGNLMGIFIEGTRAKTDEFLPPKNGVSLIAYDTQTPVIPICITQTEKHRLVHIGKPLSLEDMGLINGGAKELRAASRIIMDHIKAIRAEDMAK